MFIHYLCSWRISIRVRHTNYKKMKTKFWKITQKKITRYVPTVFENYSSDVPYNGDTYLLQMWDTAGSYSSNFTTNADTHDFNSIFVFLFLKNYTN